jgi:photosystem II stability/assembly factor-like uncharacterized protein
MRPLTTWRRLCAPLTAVSTLTLCPATAWLMAAYIASPHEARPMSAIAMLLGVLSQGVAGVAAASIVSDDIGRRPLSVRRAVTGALSRVPALLLLLLIAALSLFAVALGLVMGIGLLASEFLPKDGSATIVGGMLVAGIILWLPVGLVIVASLPVLAVERTSALKALKRTVQLLQGRWRTTISRLFGFMLIGLVPFAVGAGLSALKFDVAPWVTAVGIGVMCLTSAGLLQLMPCVATLALVDAGLGGHLARVSPNDASSAPAFAGLTRNPWFQFCALTMVVAAGVTVYNAAATNAYAVVLTFRRAAAVPWTGQEQGVFEYMSDVAGFGSAAVVVGEAGLVMTSADAGLTWQRQPSGINVQLRSVTLRSGNRVDAVGDNGTMIYSTDGGRSWSRRALPAASPNAASAQRAAPSGLSAMTWATDERGFVTSVDGSIYRSEDGGGTWSLSFPDPQHPAGLFNVAFRDSAHGAAVGSSGRVMTTDDAGRTWIQRPNDKLDTLYAVAWHDSAVVAVGAHGAIVRSTDAGLSWVPVSSGVTDDLNDIQLSRDGKGTIVGMNGLVLRSSDAGASWTRVDIGSNGHLSSVAQLGGTTELLVGSTMMASTDAGITWHERAYGRANALSRVAMIDPSTAVAVGFDGSIIVTRDAGRSWTMQPSGTEGVLSEVAFSGQTGIAVGITGGILGSTDGGTTWTSASIDAADRMLGVRMTDSRTAIAVGLNGGVYKSVNGGASWVRQAGGPRDTTLLDLSFADPSVGTAVGLDGVILRTTDGGASWIRQNSGIKQGLTAVHMIDPNTAVAVGAGGVLLRTSDAGATWKTQNLPSSQLEDVRFLDASVGFAVGREGAIQITSDGGLTWSARPSGTSDALSGINFSDRQHGFIVGGRGTILRTDDGGLSWRRP